MDQPFIKEFEIRWNDLDANMHLANTSFMAYMVHTRMAFLEQYKIGTEAFGKHNMGPVIFYEHIYYFKEARPNEKLQVSLALGGMSEDGMFFLFKHNFYNAKGKNIATCNALGGWIDRTTRSLRPPPAELVETFKNIAPRTENFKWLAKADTRVEGVVPKDLAQI